MYAVIEYSEAWPRPRLYTTRIFEDLAAAEAKAAQGQSAADRDGRTEHYEAVRLVPIGQERAE